MTAAPRLRVEQRLVRGKHPRRPCEDLVVVTSELAAVVDGATAKDDRPWPLDGAAGPSGAWAAAVLGRALEALDPDLPPREAVDALTAALDRQGRRVHPDVPRHQRPAASVVVVNARRGELWAVGDCQWRLGGVTTRPRRLVDELAAAVRAAAAAAHAAGAPRPDVEDPAREVVLPLLRIQSALAGTGGEFGYGQLDGLPVLDEHLRVVPLPALCTVVLASDGYPELHDTLEDTEAALRRALRADPECVGPLRGTKGVAVGADSFDDRAYLRVALG